MPPDEPLDLWLRTALDAADAGARIHADHLDRVGAGDARLKGRADFVSEVDEAAQRAILSLIRARHPDHLILAEEDDAPPALPDDDTPLWVVDPLDGTTNFLHGHPMHAASVAVTVGGRPMAGAVVCAPTGERWWARRGGGAWRNDRRIRVADSVPMERTLIGTGFPFKAMHELDRFLAAVRNVLGGTSGIRRGGAAAIDLAYVADGRFDGFWEYGLSPWDVAAGILLIEEAGGVVERVEGGPVDLRPGSVIAGSSRAVVDRLRAWTDRP
ncbi:inositol monophosphatase family protein [Gaopeijia maritima]|uniref:Inositol-1-monophosphatase n=1 Tax=Gaopeijia maritima TaxID=3119007 RepID=A0ABU9EEB3_9BACT